MFVAVVIPCLNEAIHIARTCASLGFGLGLQHPEQTILILVDNGSTDGTYEILRQILRGSPNGTVFVFQESERGYVPPRHRGVVEAAAIAAQRCIAGENFLILQADADTTYEKHYIRAMVEASRRTNGPALFEGLSERPATSSEFDGFWALAAQVDSTMEPWMAPARYDILVDDKVAAYLLSDYFSWGGHRREFDSFGDEIHAETARLCFRAMSMGANRVRVENATARTSLRKIIKDPVTYFATAGFPQTKRWLKAWAHAYRGPNTLSAFNTDDAEFSLQTAINYRQSHERALLGLLPSYVAMILGSQNEDNELFDKFRDDLAKLGPLTKSAAATNTALLFEKILSTINFPEDGMR